jgi:HJR/Mrr/RecB family endonuclease
MTEQAAVIETPAPQSQEDALGAIYDKLTATGIEPEPEGIDHVDVQEEKAEEVTATDATETAAAEEAEAKEQEPAPKPEAPTDLPASIRAKWDNMPEDARDAVLASHRDLTRKMADQGRVVQVAKPVYDVLVQAVQQIPTMADMTPAQIAGDVFRMAQIQGQLAQNPVQTLAGHCQAIRGVGRYQAAVSGENPSQVAQENMALAQEVRALRSQLQNIANPQAIEQQVNQTLTIRDTERMVSEYATQKEHWSAAEPVIPQMIEIAKQRLGEGASAKDILDAAYDMAIHAIPDLRAKATKPAAPTPAMPDPARTAAQLKAKSVNTPRSTQSGKPIAQTEEAVMGAVWDKYRS